MVRWLTLLTLLFLGVACGAKPSASLPPSAANQNPETATSSAPKTYERAQFSDDDLRKLDIELPEKVRRVLEQSDEVEVFSIGESPMKVVAVKDNAKAELLDAFYGGILNPEPMAGCFYPHHGLRAKHDGSQIEIKICFTCHNFVGNWGTGGPFGGRTGRMGRSPEATFNRILGKG